MRVYYDRDADLNLIKGKKRSEERRVGKECLE